METTIRGPQVPAPSAGEGLNFQHHEKKYLGISFADGATYTKINTLVKLWNNSFAMDNGPENQEKRKEFLLNLQRTCQEYLDTHKSAFWNFGGKRIQEVTKLKNHITSLLAKQSPAVSLADPMSHPARRALDNIFKKYVDISKIAQSNFSSAMDNEAFEIAIRTKTLAKNLGVFCSYPYSNFDGESTCTGMICNSSLELIFEIDALDKAVAFSIGESQIPSPQIRAWAMDVYLNAVRYQNFLNANSQEIQGYGPLNALPGHKSESFTKVEKAQNLRPTFDRFVPRTPSENNLQKGLRERYSAENGYRAASGKSYANDDVVCLELPENPGVLAIKGNCRMISQLYTPGYSNLSDEEKKEMMENFYESRKLGEESVAVLQNDPKNKKAKEDYQRAYDLNQRALQLQKRTFFEHMKKTFQTHGGYMLEMHPLDIINCVDPSFMDNFGFSQDCNLLVQYAPGLFDEENTEDQKFLALKDLFALFSDIPSMIIFKIPTYQADTDISYKKFATSGANTEIVSKLQAMRGFALQLKELGVTYKPAFNSPEEKANYLATLRDRGISNDYYERVLGGENSPLNDGYDTLNALAARNKTGVVISKEQDLLPIRHAVRNPIDPKKKQKYQDEFSEKYADFDNVDFPVLAAPEQPKLLFQNGLKRNRVASMLNNYTYIYLDESEQKALIGNHYMADFIAKAVGLADSKDFNKNYRLNSEYTLTSKLVVVLKKVTSDNTDLQIDEEGKQLATEVLKTFESSSNYLDPSEIAKKCYTIAYKLNVRALDLQRKAYTNFLTEFIPKYGGYFLQMHPVDIFSAVDMNMFARIAADQDIIQFLSYSNRYYIDMNKKDDQKLSVLYRFCCNIVNLVMRVQGAGVVWVANAEKNASYANIFNAFPTFNELVIPTLYHATAMVPMLKEFGITLDLPFKTDKEKSNYLETLRDRRISNAYFEETLGGKDAKEATSPAEHPARKAIQDICEKNKELWEFWLNDDNYRNFTKDPECARIVTEIISIFAFSKKLQELTERETIQEKAKDILKTARSLFIHVSTTDSAETAYIYTENNWGSRNSLDHQIRDFSLEIYKAAGDYLEFLENLS